MKPRLSRFVPGCLPGLSNLFTWLRRRPARGKQRARPAVARSTRLSLEVLEGLLLPGESVTAVVVAGLLVGDPVAPLAGADLGQLTTEVSFASALPLDPVVTLLTAAPADGPSSPPPPLASETLPPNEATPPPGLVKPLGDDLVQVFSLKFDPAAPRIPPTADGLTGQTGAAPAAANAGDAGGSTGGGAPAAGSVGGGESAAVPLQSAELPTDQATLEAMAASAAGAAPVPASFSLFASATTATPVPQAALSDSGSAGTPTPPAPAADQTPRRRELPIRFEQNVGQTDSRVRYYARAPGYTLFLTDHATAVLTLDRPATTPSAVSATTGGPLQRSPLPEPVVQDVLRMHFVGAETTPQISSRGKLPGRSNYLIGSPENWHTGVKSYSQIRYGNLYNGIDLIYHGDRDQPRQLEYDFVLQPTADLAAIQMRFEGASAVTLDAAGRLVLQTAGGGTLIQPAPVSYQNINGRRQSVTSQFTLQSDGSIGFQVGAYDSSLPLVIDPVLNYSTFVGGSGPDEATAVATDDDDNAFVTGYSSGLSFPLDGYSTTLTGSADAFVIKFDPSGSSALYSTYLGASSGATTVASSIAVDASGAAFITGTTNGASYPTTSGVFQETFSGTSGQEAFLTKLSSDGASLDYSSFYGASGSDERGDEVVVDDAGQAFVAGVTPTGSSVSDLFVFQVSDDGSTLLYDVTFTDAAASKCGLAVASDGNAYVAARTSVDSGFTTTGAYQEELAGASDGVVLKLDDTGSVVAGSYLGGAGGDEEPIALTLDDSGNLHVVGWTSSSTGFPVTMDAFQSDPGGGYYEGFYSKLNADLSELVYSSFVGGSDFDYAIDLAIDSSDGSIVIVGGTQSDDFPLLNAVQDFGGVEDAFVVRVSATGTLLEASFFGGSELERAYGVSVDPAGSIYLAGITESSDLPTVNPLEGSYGGSTDGFLAKVSGTPTVQLASDTYAVNEDAGSLDIPVTLSVASSQTVIVTYATADDTAAAGADYTAATGSLTFLPDETLQTITVSILEDTRDEYDETFTLTLTGATNATLASPDAAAVTIQDDGMFPTLFNTGVDDERAQLDAGNEDEHWEGFGSSFTAKAVRNPPSIWLPDNNSAASAWISPSSDGLIGAGTQDYGTTFTLPSGVDPDTLVLHGRLSADNYVSDIKVNGASTGFTTADGDWDVWTDFTLDSGFQEDANTIEILVANPVDPRVSTQPGGLRVEWTDSSESDPPPTVAFSAGSYTVSEDGGTATITVRLSAESGKPITVVYATSNGTATAGSDYTATSGTLTFAVGQTERTFTVAITDDTLDENSETINLTLSSPTNAEPGSLITATLTITDNDPNFTWTINPTPPPVFTDPGDQDSEEGATVNLSVTATDPEDRPITYDAVNLPAGLSIDSDTGEITGSVDYQAAEDFGGVYPITVIAANDGGGSAAVSFTWTVSDTPRAPVLTPPDDQTNAAGASVSLQVSASQPDDDRLIYDASGLPRGLEIGSETGLISGTIDPSAASATAYSVTITVTDYVPETPQTASETFTWTVGAPVPSTVLADPDDQVNAVRDTVELELSASDGGGYPLTFIATGLPDGLAIEPRSGIIHGTIADSAASATPYSVTVTASDGQTTTTQSFTWTVGAVGLIYPGNQSNLDGETAFLTITAWEAADNPLAYDATGLPSGLSINSSTGVISGTVDSSANTNSPYTVTVTATHGTDSASATFGWIVDRLALDNPGNQQDLEGATVSLEVDVTDLAGTPTFSATGLPDGLSINSSTGEIAGTIDSAAQGQSPYLVTVTATDGSSSSSRLFLWTVTPQVLLVSPGPQGNAVGDTVSLTVTATDRANGTLTYSAPGLPGGLSIDSGTGVISGTIGSGAVSGSPHAVTVTAADGTYSSSQTFAWSVATIYLASPGAQANLDDDVVSLSLTAAYHGSGTLSYSADGLPDGLSIDTATGEITGTLTDTADADSPYAVTVTASHGTDSASQAFTWFVSPRVTVDALADQANVPGDIVSLTVSATSAASGTVTWTYDASGLPSGLSIDSSTGVISGTITASVSGTPSAVTVTASDGTASASQTFNWSVVPVLLARPGDQMSVGEATVNLSLSADVASGYTASYSVTGLPGGLSINSSTGVISGTLNSGDTNHSYLVTVSATAGGVTSTQTFGWRVGTVVVAPLADQTDLEGDAVSLAVSAGALSGTLAYIAGGLPDGLSIDASTGVISGTIAAGTAGGSRLVTVAASNGTMADNQVLFWTVDSRVTVDSLDDQSNLEGDTVSLQVTASAPGGTLTYSATDLPDGLSIDSGTGLISGTVATGASADEPFVTQVTVGDGTYSNGIWFRWTIAHGNNTDPALTNPGPQANVLGDWVYLPLSASDADDDALVFSATGLPDGLSIDPASGVISGAVADEAASSALYTVVVHVDDRNGGTATQSFSWIVTPAIITVQAVPLSAIEGSSTGSITVATFTTPDLLTQAWEFTATINWGDDDTSIGTVTGGEGAFSVIADHVYAEVGSYSASITMTGPGGNSVTANGTATVAGAPLTLVGDFVLGAIHEQSSSFKLAIFTDDNAGRSPENYQVEIAWGDETTSSGSFLVAEESGSFQVVAPHTYAQNGNYTVTIAVTDIAGEDTVTATSAVTVADLYAGVASTLTVSYFTVADTSATAMDFTATIDWGDGDTSAGTVAGSNGTFSVQGSHTYAADSQAQPNGVYLVTVTFTDQNAHSLVGSGTVSVTQPETVEWAERVAATPDEPLDDVEVATFLTPNVSVTAAEFGAQIDWGDGTPLDTNATIVGSGGVFHVLASHTYLQGGLHYLRVSVGRFVPLTSILLLEATAVQQATVRERLIIKGPRSVPGGSRYEFWVGISDTGIPEGEIDLIKATWDHGNSAFVETVSPTYRYVATGTNLITSLAVLVTFKNQPGIVTLKLKFTRTVAGQNPVEYMSEPVTIDVVQLKIATRPAYVPRNQSQLPNQIQGRLIEGTGLMNIYTRPPDARYEPRELENEESYTRILETGVVSSEAYVTLIGPGDEGLRGVGQIKLGWVRNTVSTDFKVSYERGGYAIFEPKLPNGTLVSGPWLDTAPRDDNPNPGTGGKTAFVRSSVSVPLNRPPGTVGVTRRVVTLDAPVWTFRVFHPNVLDASWTQTEGGSRWVDHLSAYTTGDNHLHPTVQQLDRYVVVAQVPWRLELVGRKVGDAWVKNPARTGVFPNPLRLETSVKVPFLGFTFTLPAPSTYVPTFKATAPTWDQLTQDVNRQHGTQLSYKP